MNRILFVLTFFLTASLNSTAQSAQDSVKNAVNRLFEGMIKSDATILRQSFADSAILQTILTNKDGKTVVRNESIDEFAVSIGKLPKGAADERITFETLRIDGALATVWCPYSFYYNGQFSHCGVDSFQLVRVNGEWKIQYLIDTRRKQPCTI